MEKGKGIFEEIRNVWGSLVVIASLWNLPRVHSAELRAGLHVADGIRKRDI
jgi:hypothetical protein